MVDVTAFRGGVRVAICACRQAGHQQPMARLSGTGTAGGRAVHQHGPLACGSVWPHWKVAPQRVHTLMAVFELASVCHAAPECDADVTGSKRAGWGTYRARL